MQQVRSNRDTSHESITREGGPSVSSTVGRSDLSSLVNDYTSSQRQYHDRLESLERELASLKGQVTQSFVPPTNEHELNRASSTKKTTISQPTSARILSSSRIPLGNNARKLSNDETPIVSTNDGPFSRSLPQVSIIRSRSFHNSTLNSSSSPPTNSSEEASFLRSYKTHIEQVLRKDAPPFSDMKIPNYVSIDDVMKANEQLLVENDRLRSELNRLKTESILLLRSMRATTGFEPNMGNERIIAERERQELAVELARQVEENKRLRRSLLSQSAKFLTLRQSNNITDAPLSTSNDNRLTPESAPQPTLNFNRTQQQQHTKSTRFIVGNRGMARPRTFNHGSHDPLINLGTYSNRTNNRQSNKQLSIRRFGKIAMQFRSIILVFLVICLIVVTFFSNVVESGQVFDNKNQNNYYPNKNNAFVQRMRRRARNTHRRYRRDDDSFGGDNHDTNDDEYRSQQLGESNQGNSY